MTARRVHGKRNPPPRRSESTLLSRPIPTTGVSSSVPGQYLLGAGVYADAIPSLTGTTRASLLWPGPRCYVLTGTSRSSSSTWARGAVQSFWARSSNAAIGAVPA